MTSLAMGDDQKADPPSKDRPRKRRWLKRIAWVLLGALGLVVVFHRPLVFEGTRYFVVRAAKQQNLDITYEIGGSIFSTLSIKNLRGTPTEPGPIQRLEIGAIDLEYSLWGWMRNGLPALLDLVAVKDAWIELTPAEEPPPEKEAEPQQVKFPALFPKTLLIENVNVVIRAATGDTVIEGFWFTLLPDQPGVLRVATLDIPGVRRWEGIDGKTTFRERNLLLTDLAVGPEIQLDQFNLDASKLDEAELGVGLDGRFFEAPISVGARISDLNATNEFDAQISVADLVLDRVWEYLALEVPASATIDELSVEAAGRPDQPASWKGTVTVRIADIVAEERQFGRAAVDVVLAGGYAELGAELRPADGASLDVEASAILPWTLDELAKPTANGRLQIAVEDLTSLDPAVQGNLNGDIRFELAHGWLYADGPIRSASIGSGDAELGDVVVQLGVQKNLCPPEDAPPFEDLRARVWASVGSVRVQDYEIDALRVALGVDDALVWLTELDLAKGPNSVRASGVYTLPADMASFSTQPWKADLAVEAPELRAFVAEGAGAELEGSATIKGSAQSTDGAITGDFVIAGREIAANGLTVPTVDGNLSLADGRARLADFALVFDESNSVRASGDVVLAEPYTYSGTLNADLTDLSLFDVVSPEPLAGSLKVAWTGNGDQSAHTGSATIDLANGQFGAQAGLTAEVRANYTPERIDIPVLRAATELAGVETVIRWEDRRLTVSALTARLGELTVLTGSLALPLDLAHLDNVDLLIPNDGAVDVALTVPELRLPSLFEQLSDDPAPITGTVSGTVTASSTVAALRADVAFRGANLVVPDVENVQPATINFDAALRDGRLAIDGKLTEPRIQPLTISGGLPLDVARIKREGALPDDTPIVLSARMARSPLRFVAGLVPVIRFIDGSVEIDAGVTGTLAAPQIAGDVAVDVTTLQLNTPGLPPIRNTVVRLDATTERLTVSQFRGEMGGGVFGAEGGVDFSNPQRPLLNLRFGSRDALVMQDESISLRLSSRIAVAGPLDSAKVSGDVWVTKSRFFKDIEILPIGLPGRPAPQPPDAPEPPGVPDPPLRDWTFDLAIRTADPFIVQGNLANGRITLDLRVGGTGARPWLDGGVRIEQLETSLPFSTLNIENGLVYFSRDRPFLPQFDIQGTSQIRDYSIRAFVFGTLENPEATFTSDPPLPQSEIVTLLATGVTARELGDNPSVLAGRAAILLFQRIYRSVFRRGATAPPRETLLSRIDIDVGATDLKTGRQSATVRFPLNDNVVLSGGLDVGGNFRGQVKYLIRFR